VSAQEVAGMVMSVLLLACFVYLAVSVLRERVTDRQD
jgi:hypothetical protein